MPANSTATIPGGIEQCQFGGASSTCCAPPDANSKFNLTATGTPFHRHTLAPIGDGW